MPEPMPEPPIFIVDTLLPISVKINLTCDSNECWLPAIEANFSWILK
jgi:hypothetical protein